MSDDEILEEATRNQIAATVLACFQHKELMAEYERLTGERPVLDRPGSPIAAMIDKAVGYEGFKPSPEWARFIEFVFNTVFIPLKARQAEEWLNHERR